MTSSSTAAKTPTTASAAALSPTFAAPIVDERAQRSIDYLIYEWARAIDEDRIEEAATLLLEDGEYKVASRFNLERGLPLAIIHCTSAAQLRDRIRSLRLANIYEKHFYRHMISGVQVIGASAGHYEVRANYTIIRIMEHDGATTLFSTGQYRDSVVLTDAGARFKRRHVIYDSRAIDTCLAIPI
jgi:anthranilate 1,2-dioxygenase small subunit